MFLEKKKCGYILGQTEFVSSLKGHLYMFDGFNEVNN